MTCHHAPGQKQCRVHPVAESPNPDSTVSSAERHHNEQRCMHASMGKEVRTRAGLVGSLRSSLESQPRSSATGRAPMPGSAGREACAPLYTSRKYCFSGSKLPTPSCLRGTPSSQQTCAGSAPQEICCPPIHMAPGMSQQQCENLFRSGTLSAKRASCPTPSCSCQLVSCTFLVQHHSCAQQSSIIVTRQHAGLSLCDSSSRRTHRDMTACGSGPL